MELAGDGQAHLLLLRIPEAGHPRLRRAQLHLGDFVGREPADLVGCRDFPGGAAVLVGGPPGLACRRRARRGGFLLPPLVPVPGTDHVFLLRGVLRTVPHPGAGLRPGPGSGAQDGPAVAPAVRTVRDGNIPCGCRAALRVLLSDLDWGVHPVPGLAFLVVAAALDLRRLSAGRTGPRRGRRRAPFPYLRPCGTSWAASGGRGAVGWARSESGSPPQPAGPARQ